MASFFDNTLLSEKDRKRVDELNSAWAATDDAKLREQLHNEAETIRRSYGYSGGADGSEFIPLSTSVYTVAGSATEYADALADAEKGKQEMYSSQLTQADKDGAERLRDAYIKNMQSKLGIGQTLRAQGVSGGMAESTLASVDNNYNTVRDNILSDVDDTKRDITEQAILSQSNSDKEIAKHKYDSSLDRADRLEKQDEFDYQKQQDALDMNFRNEQFNYQKEQDAVQNEFDRYDREYQASVDKYDREYRAEQDRLNREYQAAKDAADRAQAASNASRSASNQQISNILKLIENGYYSESFADILGIPDLKYSDEDPNYVKNLVWKMLSNGVYHDSFPKIVGFSDKILKEYADSVKYGY